MLRRWCPIKEAPYLLRDEHDNLRMEVDEFSKLANDLMPVGSVREFVVRPACTLRSSASYWTACVHMIRRAPSNILCTAFSSHLVPYFNASVQPDMSVNDALYYIICSACTRWNPERALDALVLCLLASL